MTTAAEDASKQSKSNNNNNRRSLLDRSIQIILPHPDPTPSHNHGVSPDLERLHRLHGTSLIATACRLLSSSPDDQFDSCYYATACTILHRFYHVKSLQEFNVWSVAMAATLLAAKLTMDEHDQQQAGQAAAAVVSLPKVILVFQHIYRRRLLLLVQDNNDDEKSVLECNYVAASAAAKTLSLAQKQERLRRVPPCSPVGPLYHDWYQAVVQTEHMVLRALGFTLYWIPDQQQPLKYCMAFLKVLLLLPNNSDKNSNNDDYDNKNKNKNKTLAERACKYCNQACRLDLCTRFDASVIACAAIYLALLVEQQQQQQQQQHHQVLPTACWWDVLCGGKGQQQDDMATICNAILGLEHEKDARIASVAFVPSISGDSFNDPGTSFVWEVTEKELTGGVNAATSG